MRALFVLVPAAFSVGCVAPASFDGGDIVKGDSVKDGSASRDGSETSAYRVDGVVAVERVRTVEGAQTSVGAKFMRHAGLPEAAERLVGSRLILPPNGVCASIAELEDLDAETTGGGRAPTTTGPVLDGEVELIDVGDVALVTDLADIFDASATIGPEAREPFVVRLAPRAFPDVGELVSGVFYSSPDLGAPLPAPGRYAIEGTGAAATPPFELDAEAPEEPGDVLLDGAELVAGATASRGSDLLVTWSFEPRSEPREVLRDGATLDRVYVDVQAADGQVHRCAFEDDGAAIVPGALVTAPSVAVAVHRLRESTLSLAAGAEARAAGAEARDLDDAAGRVVIRFDLAVVGRVAVGAPTAGGGRADVPGG